MQLGDVAVATSPGLLQKGRMLYLKHDDFQYV